MIATIINSAAVAAGGLIGLLAKKGLPERVSKGIMTAIGLMLICAGVKGYFDGNSTIVAILSLALGTGLGELLRLEERLNRLGERIGARVSRNGGSRVGEGLVTATLLFCVFVYQGAIPLLSGLLAPVMTAAAVAELSAVGSVLLVGLGLNLAGAAKVRVMNMVPAIFIAIALAQVMH